MSARTQAKVNRGASERKTQSSNDSERGRLGEIQRRRMLAAMVEEATEHGVGNVTVAHVVARSGVSRRTFYEIFEDREDCFLAAFDDGIERLARNVIPAYERERRWKDGLRAGLAVLLELFQEDSGLGRLVVVEILGAGPRGLERRRRIVDELVRAVEEGADEAKAGGKTPPLTGEGVVGAVLSVLHARLSAQGSSDVLDLLNPLMSMIVLPYLGRAAAERELKVTLVAKPGSGARPRANPLCDLEMRLTYRTVRVLLAVAGSPGSSNRAVAEGSGITDQGQISKLLARLLGLGLIDNEAAGSARGEPNAWALTAKGKEVYGAIGVSATAPTSAQESPA